MIIGVIFILSGFLACIAGTIELNNMGITQTPAIVIAAVCLIYNIPGLLGMIFGILCIINSNITALKIYKKSSNNFNESNSDDDRTLMEKMSGAKKKDDDTRSVHDIANDWKNNKV